MQALARLVADKLGGRCSFAECAVLWAAAAACLKAQRNSVVLPLGALPVGLARHRALLFKALADANDLPCQLLRGPSYLGTFPCLGDLGTFLGLGFRVQGSGYFFFPALGAWVPSPASGA